MKFFAVIPTILADASAKVRLPIAAQYIDTWSLQWSLWLCSSDTAAYAAPAATAVDAKFAYGAPVTALNTGPLIAGPVATAAPAVAAALALAATATIFGAQYAAAYTPPVVPAVAVTPVAYATMLPQLLYAAIMVSLIMVSLMLSEPLHQNLIYKEALPTILIKDDLQVIS